jgi:transglutaminase-like putative cysteine protease
MKIELRHETRYAYDSPVRSLTEYLRLTPRDTARQKIIEWTLEAPGDLVATRDGFGNVLHVLTLDRPVAELRVLARGRVETARSADEPSDFSDTPLPPLVFLRPTAHTRADAALAAIAEAHRRHAGTLSGLRDLAGAVRRAHEEGDRRGRPAEVAVQAFIACCRHLGIPARCVSGYVAGRGTGGGAGAALANHAWAEAWVVDRWRSFDIVAGNGIGEGHVKVAMGADYLDACPLRGVRIGGGEETMTSQAQIQVSGQ